MNNDRTPTTARLAKALEEAGAPDSMVRAARGGRYDDYKCEESATPCVDLVNHLAALTNTPQFAVNEKIVDLRARAMKGEFDAQKWESDEWARSVEADPEMGPLLKALGLRADQ